MRTKIAGLKDMDTTGKLLLYCTRWALPTADASLEPDQQILEADIDWKRALDDARRHGLISLLYLAVKNSEQLRGIPKEIEEKLRREYLATIASSLAATRELSAILEKFNEKSIPAIVLKGPFLAENIYSQKNIRPYTDLDILVKKEDLPSTQLLLSELGYKQCYEIPRFWWEEEYPERTFTKNKPGNLLVEIQWNILDKKSYLQSMNFDVADIWEKASKGEINGQPTLKMAPEHLLIYLCLHLSVTHHFERLIWLRDLAEVVNFYRNSFDWGYFKECVFGWKTKTYVYYPLLMANEILGAGIPKDVLDDIRPRYLTARLFERALSRANIVRLPKHSLANALFLIPRDRPCHRYKAILVLPCQAMRWCLKGRTR